MLHTATTVLYKCAVTISVKCGCYLNGSLFRSVKAVRAKLHDDVPAGVNTFRTRDRKAKVLLQ